MIVMFRTKRDKEMLLEKAKKMEEYASMIVDCIEESREDEYSERNYKHEDEYDEKAGRYDYRRRMR